MKFARIRRVLTAVHSFDNERNKGDHCHIDDIELPYQFVSPEQLMDDFLGGVAILREG